MSNTSHIEVERRYLLSAGPPDDVMEAQPDHYVVYYEHRYLPGSTIRERVTKRSIQPTYKRTVKVGTGSSRFEFEEEVDVVFWEMFEPLTRYSALRCKRWCVRDADLTGWFAAQTGVQPPRKLKWEVTHVLNLRKSLWLLEVETPAVFEGDPPFPGWLAPYVLREVTQDERYEAFSLAMDGEP